MIKKLAKPLSALNPFGAVKISLPPSQIFQSALDERNLSLKTAKTLYRHLGWAIKAHERDFAKFVRGLTKTSPYRKILRGGKFPSEIRGVK